MNVLCKRESVLIYLKIMAMYRVATAEPVQKEPL